jgi:hypothetical protein
MFVYRKHIILSIAKRLFSFCKLNECTPFYQKPIIMMCTVTSAFTGMEGEWGGGEHEGKASSKACGGGGHCRGLKAACVTQ